MDYCYNCGGSLKELGQHGRYMIYRCQNCGLDTRQEVPGECAKCGCATWFSASCGAEVCNACDHHAGLVRCYCGWSASGSDGRRELVEMGETIEPDEGDIAFEDVFPEEARYRRLDP